MVYHGCRQRQWNSNCPVCVALGGPRRRDRQKPNDPAKLGDALVKIVAMQNPPKVFVAGSDALSMIGPAIEERLREMRANETLSKSMDGSFA